MRERYGYNKAYLYRDRENVNALSNVKGWKFFFFIPFF